VKKLYVVCDGCGEDSYSYDFPEGWFELRVLNRTHEIVEEVDLCPECYNGFRHDWALEEEDEEHSSPPPDHGLHIV